MDKLKYIDEDNISCNYKYYCNYNYLNYNFIFRL